MLKFKYKGSIRELEEELIHTIDENKYGETRMASNHQWQYQDRNRGTLNFYASTGTIMLQGTETGELDLEHLLFNLATQDIKTNEQSLWIVIE